jgi:ABC-type glycerol-3-phosphate transport system substrate-binding protein
MNKRLIIFFILTLSTIVLLSCSKPGHTNREIVILIRMMDIQDEWFRKELQDAAKKQFDVTLTFKTFNDHVDLENLLRIESELGEGTIAVVKTHSTVLGSLAKQGYILPLESVVPKSQLTSDLDEYLDLAVSTGTIDGKIFYIPRKIEVNTFLYLKSKVKKAVSLFPKYEKDIRAMFKFTNGVGLPKNFNLERDPNSWDWYDLAAVSYIWSREPDETGAIFPRIAHRGKDYEGTTFELLTKHYQINGTPDSFITLEGQEWIDTLEWEAFYVENGLYNTKMWEESWSGGGIWNGFKENEVYAAFMHQIDSFFIHGGTHPKMKGYLANPEDMAVALMPKGASLEINNDGLPARIGNHYSGAGGWWWGIPKTSPDPKLSYDIIRLITSKEFHLKECQTFGMLPIRKDLYIDMNDIYPLQWQREVFETGINQYRNFSKPSANHPQYGQISQVIRNAWFQVIVQENYSSRIKSIDPDIINKNLIPFQTEIKEYMKRQ